MGIAVQLNINCMSNIKFMQKLYNESYFMAVSLIRFSGLVQLREIIKSAGRRTRCGVWE